MDLLDDLEALGDDTIEQIEQGGPEEGESGSDEEMEDMGLEADELLRKSIKEAENVFSVAKIYNSKNLRWTVEKINEFGAIPMDNIGRISDHPEYKVIVNSSSLAAQVDDDIQIVHKFIKDHYAPRFPELETLVANPLEYARVVKAIGNETDLMKLDLKLPQATLMIIVVTFTTSAGRLLTEDELARVAEACGLMEDLERTRVLLTEYVKSRMDLIAPNLVAIVGSETAAKLMAVAGGLDALGKIPACNLQSVGKALKVNTGLSALGHYKHGGIIYYSDMVIQIPLEYRKKATKLIAAKCALAIRIDLARESLDGHQGRRLREEVDQKIEKMQEPPPGMNVKALPVPILESRKKRAGKRFRRQKEKYGMTELKRAQNRMAFGVAEEEVLVMDEMEGLGMVGSGKIRAVGAKNVKIGLSKKYKAITGAISSSGPIAGTATSLAFTPVQGIQLANPEEQLQKAKDANDKWFSGGFASAKKTT